MSETPAQLLSRLFREIDEAIDATRKETLGMTTDTPAFPPIPDHVWRIDLHRIDEVPLGRSIPYVCAQVGRLGRGQIGLNPDGQVVFYLHLEDIDKIANFGLQDADDVWVVLRPSQALTDPYHGS